MNKQQEFVGVGSIGKVEALINSFAGTRIFLVTGKSSFKESGAEQALEEVLQKKIVYRFSDFSTNPNLSDIEKGIFEFRKFSPDLVIAVGGGSVIDTAKAITNLAFQDGALINYLRDGKQLVETKIPVIAIPTTSGSGAEATHFAVVYRDKIKYSLVHPSLLPTVAIVDPAFTYSLSPEITRATGIDTLAQAIESYWSIYSTQESKEYAKKALLMAKENLKAVVLAPSDEARVAMSEAAHLAGKAINISKTTAPHAFSYPFTMHFGIPHGEAVALTLSQVLLYNSRVTESDCNDPRGFQYVQHAVTEIIEILGVKTPSEAVGALDTLFDDIGLERTPAKRGISPNDLDMILVGASSERMGNNPRKISEIDARKILENIICN